MQQLIFNDIFSDLYIPVVVCKDNDDYPIVYMNIRAGMLFSPSHSVEALSGNTSYMSLRTLFSSTSDDVFHNNIQMLINTGHIDDYTDEIVTYEGNYIQANLTSNHVTIGDNGYFILYITGFDKDQIFSGFERSLTSIINSSFSAMDVDSTINQILAITGENMDVDRVYIFEEISPTTTRNTYEWCAQGVDPAIQDLQHLDKCDYNYDIIVNSGMYITDDVMNIPIEGGREILEMQGIKSLAILTFYDNDRPLGYVGYDDTKKTRKWSMEEIQYLKSVSNLIAILIKRRKAEEAARNTLDIMQIISDHSNDIVYVNSIDDYTIKFVSESLATSVGKKPEELIGKICWQEFHRERDDVCSFCPIPKIKYDSSANHSEVYEWEHKNPITGKTYLAKDNLIRWVDGSIAHIETAVDISSRIEQEEQLRILASTDTMTGVFNRQWGTRLLEEQLGQTGGNTKSLGFCDLDGLKSTNDIYGHASGDIFLKEIVSVIQKELTEGEFICRWGGDEFMVLFNTGIEETKERFLKIQQELTVINERGTYPFALSFSFGIVPFSSENGDNLDSLATKADLYMYENKMRKRGVPMGRRRTDPPVNN